MAAESPRLAVIGAGIAGLSYTEAKGLIGHASKTQESD